MGVAGSSEGRVGRRRVHGMMSENEFDLWVYFLFQPQKSFGQSRHFISSQRVTFLHRFYVCDLNSRGYHCMPGRVPMSTLSSLASPHPATGLAFQSWASSPCSWPETLLGVFCGNKSRSPLCPLTPSPHPPNLVPGCMLKIPHWAPLGPGRQISP